MKLLGIFGVGLGAYAAYTAVRAMSTTNQPVVLAHGGFPARFSYYARRPFALPWSRPPPKMFAASTPWGGPSMHPDPLLRHSGEFDVIY